MKTFVLRVRGEGGGIKQLSLVHRVDTSTHHRDTSTRHSSETCVLGTAVLVYESVVTPYQLFTFHRMTTKHGGKRIFLLQGETGTLPSEDPRPVGLLEIQSEELARKLQVEAEALNGGGESGLDHGGSPAPVEIAVGSVIAQVSSHGATCHRCCREARRFVQVSTNCCMSKKLGS